MYGRALRRLRGNKEAAVVVEGSLHAIQTAKSAGFRVCAVYDPSAEAAQQEIQRIADYYIRSYDELLQSETLE